MKKKIILLLAVLLVLAGASVASADILDPNGGGRNRPRPQPVVPGPGAPTVEIISQPAESPGGDHALLFRFSLPDPGSCQYMLFDNGTNRSVLLGEKKNETEEGIVEEERFVYPHVPGGETARYTLVTDFSLYRSQQTSFGPKRRSEPETMSLVQVIYIRCNCDGPSVTVSEAL